MDALFKFANVYFTTPVGAVTTEKQYSHPLDHPSIYSYINTRKNADTIDTVSSALMPVAALTTLYGKATDDDDVLMNGVALTGASLGGMGVSNLVKNYANVKLTQDPSVRAVYVSGKPEYNYMSKTNPIPEKWKEDFDSIYN